MTSLEARTDYVRECAEYLGRRYAIDPTAITERKGRLYAVALCRHLIAYRLSQMHWTTTEIGQVLRIDHSTVTHAVTRIGKLIRADRDVAADYAGMPAMGAQSFTDANLVAMYRRLTAALDDAEKWRKRIDEELRRQSMPLRAVR